MPNYYTPLRYPGGKGRLIPFLKAIVEENHNDDVVYAEPYTGGGAVALALLFDEYVSRIVINDKDYRIYCLWNSIVNNTEEFINLLYEVPISVETWNVQKNISRIPEEYTELEVGFATFFLNRTNRSGIIDGGIIGGREQHGKWKIDARFNKDNLEKKIHKIGTFRDRITVKNLDAIDLTAKLNSSDEEKLVYYDPPYYVKGGSLYMNHYRHEDHEKVANCIANSNFNWVVSYDDHEEILKMYNLYRHHLYTLSYSAAKVHKGGEAIFFSPDLNISEALPLLPNYLPTPPPS